HRPANLFVARFIGSPPINLLTLGEMGANLLSGGMLKQVQAAARSDQVILGVRPEDLQVVRAMRAAGFEARVSLVEPMGSETWLDLVWGEERLRARVAADVTVQAGEQVTVRFDEQKAHFFDGETGARLF
ncbi:MAG TPA: TOBE domain-containing protein, partial [Methylomirabilota bacterium]|nr:TOBE domain-containing protein [Methylomirabilota bacterium]